VRDLKNHRPTCLGRVGGGTRRRKGRAGGVANPPMRGCFNSTVECYDCHQQVVNLKMHRSVCPNSRKNKSLCARGKKHVDNTHQINVTVSGTCHQPTIVDFSRTTDFYTLLDVSGSMSGNRLNHAKSVLTEMFGEMHENDRISIVTFDTNAYFKLKPRPVGQIRRQNELGETLNRIFAQGLTAIWDAIWLAVSQIQDKSKRTVLFVLTDGKDNSSSHTYQQVIDLVAQYPNISLSIVHIDGSGQIDPQYLKICQENKGDYVVIQSDSEIKPEMNRLFQKHYLNINITI